MFYKKTAYCLIAYYISKVYSYEKLENIDFYGGDMYPIYSVNESIMCMNLCEKVRDCVAVTHCDNTCYIKDKKMLGVIKENCTTFDMYPEDDIWSSSWGSKEIDIGYSKSNEPTEEIVFPTVTPKLDGETPSTEKVEVATEIPEVSSSNIINRKFTYALTSSSLAFGILFL